MTSKRFNLAGGPKTDAVLGSLVFLVNPFVRLNASLRGDRNRDRKLALGTEVAGTYFAVMLTAKPAWWRGRISRACTPARLALRPARRRWRAGTELFRYLAACLSACCIRLPSAATHRTERPVGRHARCGRHFNRLHALGGLSGCLHRGTAARHSPDSGSACKRTAQSA